MLLDQISIHSWINHNQIKTESGSPLDFKTHRFLFDIYADRSPFICAIKAAQIGFTTYEILKSLHEAKNDQIDIIYVLPTADDVKQFSGGKTNRIIDNNPILQTWTADKDSVEQKKVGKATIYYRGSWTERTALMISARKLIVDELDRCKPEIVEQYDSRLQHAISPRKAFFSNPTIPDFGIDKYWKMSDQKKWHVNHSCGARVLLDESCINYDKEIFECTTCRKEITDEERRKGEWIATAKGEWSGYWIPLWVNPMFNAKKIKEYKKTKTAEYFTNFVAGLPYTGSGNKVQASTIIKCLSDKVNDQTERNIIGIDTGIPIYYVVANKKGFFNYGKFSDPSSGKDPYLELEALMRRWPTSIVISDGNGDLSGIRILQAKYPGRVFLCFYTNSKSATDIIKWGDGNKYGEVTINVDKVIQQFIDEMVDRSVVFNGTESDWQEFISHWLNMYRTWERDESGQIDKSKGFKWDRNGPNHWASASVFARIGLEKYAETMASFIGQDQFEGVPMQPAVQIL